MRVPLLLGVLMAAALVGCKKTAKNNPPDSAPPPAQSGGGDSGGIMPAGGVGIVLNPQAALGGAYPRKTNAVASPYNGLPAETVDAIKAGHARVLVDWVRVTR